MYWLLLQGITEKVADGKMFVERKKWTNERKQSRNQWVDQRFLMRKAEEQFRNSLTLVVSRFRVKRIRPTSIVFGDRTILLRKPPINGTRTGEQNPSSGAFRKLMDEVPLSVDNDLKHFIRTAYVEGLASGSCGMDDEIGGDVSS
jgi:hypothetical protein